MEKDVQQEVVETVETETENEVEAETTEGTVTETEDTPAKEVKDEDVKKQTADENKKFAEQRRAKEAKEREEAIRKAKQEGVVEGLGGINPFTSEKIVDDIDFELYQEMKDASNKGYDPLSVKDMTKYRKEVALEAKKQEEAKNLVKINAQKDIDSFVKNHPDIKVNELMKDKDFVDFSQDLLGSVPLETIYKKYGVFQEGVKAKAERLALEEKARRGANPGSLTTDNPNVDNYSIDDIKKMSREQIEANYDKVIKAYFKK